ncbi:MAG: molybdopterin molybdotransferase MoeA [Actinobacteria bacterium]|nr:molybdopterin molybdotransferase MoeA [Actinomycetota bacterium]
MAISLERARELVRAASGPPLPAEAVPVAEAAGRVLAGELRAAVDYPLDTNSAMDGFAVTAGPAGRTLRLVGESRAGSPASLGVDPSSAIRIATGGVLPAGAEAVVRLERASLTGDGAQVTLHDPTAPGHNVRRAGEDMMAGQRVLPGGIRLGSLELAVAIGAGHGELACHRRPRVALLGTGDELRDPGVRLAAGEIHDSNTIVLAALARAAGAWVTGRRRVPDDPAAARHALDRALAEADVVVVTGGVSVGPHDHVKPALRDLGAEEIFWGVAIRPGRPTWFGRRGETLVFGLPGNPVSAIVAFVLLVRPLLAVLAGDTAGPAPVRARLAVGLARHPDRTDAVRVRLRRAVGPASPDRPDGPDADGNPGGGDPGGGDPGGGDPGGGDPGGGDPGGGDPGGGDPGGGDPGGGDRGLEAHPTAPPGSHLVTSLVGADGLALVPAGRGELASGSLVDVERL